MRNRPGWILTLACVLIFSGPARLRAQVVDKGKEEPKAIKAIVEESIGWYQVFIDSSAPEAMTPHPVLRWRNVTRGTQESEGVFVLWVNKGRPEASASIYPWEGTVAHEFVSLSRGAKLVAREGGRVIWSPETPGVEFKDIPGAPAPADTPAARLRQMKVLADRFKVTMTGWKPDKSDREELRLLPKPLYRAELSERAGTRPRLDRRWRVCLCPGDGPGGHPDAGSGSPERASALAICLRPSNLRQPGGAARQDGCLGGRIPPGRRRHP